MTTLLHVASSSNLTASYSRKIGRELVDDLKRTHPDLRVIERDLVQSALPHISPQFVGAMFTNPAAPELALSRTLTDEVLASDVLLIEVPMYNFSIPSALKAWIDHIVRSGITFSYGANGPEGLAKNKKAILVISRGGSYSDGPAKAMDYQETYMRSILGFIGITDVEIVRAEGVLQGEEKLALALDTAHKQAALVVQHVG